MISCEINNISSCSSGTVNTFTFTCHRICLLSSLHGIAYFVKMIIIISIHAVSAVAIMAILLQMKF